LTDSLAGFLLGILLLVIGVLGMVLQGRQTVVVDPGTRRITMADQIPVLDQATDHRLW